MGGRPSLLISSAAVPGRGHDGGRRDGGRRWDWEARWGIGITSQREQRPGFGGEERQRGGGEVGAVTRRRVESWLAGGEGNDRGQAAVWLRQ